MKSRQLNLVGFTYLYVIFLAIILIAIASLKLTKPSFTPVLQKNQWHVPELPNGLNWSKMSPTEEELGSARMTYDFRFMEGPERPSAQIPVTGAVYKISEKYNEQTHQDNRLEQVFGDYTESLESNGWKQQVQVGNALITGAAASGVNGNILGYVKIIDSKIRTVVISDMRHWSRFYIDESDDVPVQKTECPCSYNLSIFVSDEINIPDQLLQR